VLGEGQDTVDVELIEDGVIQLDLSERELFAKLVSIMTCEERMASVDAITSLRLAAGWPRCLARPFPAENGRPPLLRQAGSHPFRIRVDATSTPAP